MAYQPAQNADDLSDFVPPNAVLTNVAVGSTENLAGHPAVTSEPASVSVPLNGKQTNVVSFDQGQVAVVIEENTVSTDAQLQFTAVSLPLSPITVTNTLTNPAGTKKLLEFQLEVVEAGVSVEEFEKPVRIIVDVRSLTADLNPVYADNFFLIYQDENDPTLWHDVPVTLHQESGLLSAEVMHFSGWAAGVRPERWNPSWNPPAVSAFSGAATYSYPINIPPGRGGMQPSVVLSYSSRGIDGRIHDGEPGDVADGWSLSQIAIVREGVKVESPFGSPLIHHPDKFRLVINGTGYEIYPESGVLTFDTDPEIEDPSVGALVRWYATDAPGFKIMRYYDATLPTDGLYWVVTDPNGTQYRLGYTADSEEYQVGPLWYEQETHRGDNTGSSSAIAWNVDTVTDAFGNQMTYHYYTSEVTENIAWFNADPLNPHWTSSDITTRSSRIATIKYNYNNRITTLPVTNTVARLSDTATPATRIEFRASTGDTGGQFNKPVNNIYIYHGSSANPLTEYRIVSAPDQVESDGCLDENQEGRITNTWVVDSIQQFTNTDSDPATPDSGYSLPPTLFSYINQPHHYKNSQACFSFRYLSQVQNGYGGMVTFTYTSDDRSIGEYWRQEILDDNQQLLAVIYHYPEFGYNYVVNQVTSNDGRNHTTTTYSYYKPCYGQFGSNVGGNAGNPNHITYQAFPCYTSVNDPANGNIVGFERTTQINYAFNGTTVLNKQVTLFSQATNPDTRGRPLRQEFYNSSDMLVNCSKTTYASQANGSTTFTYADEVNSYLFASGGDCAANPPTGATIQTKVSTDYDSYGNQSVVYDYGDVATSSDDRKVTYTYYPNIDNGYWMVGQVAVQQEYQGISSPTLKRETRTYYDNTSSYTQPPTQGTVRQVTVGLGSSFITTVQNTYDTYGNVATTTTPSGATTTITYDTPYNLYPTQAQVTGSGATRTTLFQIYGFAGTGVDGLHTPVGQLKQVTDSDNNLTTIYEYDPFGRLFAVYAPEDDRGSSTNAWDGNPTQRYRYWDNTWNHVAGLLNPFGITQQTYPDDYPDPPDTTPGAPPYTLDAIAYYDGFGRVFQERQRYVEVAGVYRDVIVATEYGALGQPYCTTVPFDVDTAPVVVTDNCETPGRTSTLTVHDDLGRPTSVIAPDTRSTTYSYSLTTNVQVDGYTNLQLTQVTNANGHVTQSYTNARNQLVLVREMEGTGGGATPYADTRYSYDWMGNLEWVRQRTPDNAGNGTLLAETQMIYDTWGRKIGMNDPDMGDWYYGYDTAGNLSYQIDANHYAVHFYYDVFNRLLGKTYSADTVNPVNYSRPDNSDCNSYVVCYTYDTAANGIGQVAQIRWADTLANGGDVFTYDSLGRLTSQTRWLDGRSFVVTTSSYDNLNRPLTVQYPDGEIVTLSYDHEGENSLTAGGTTLVNNIQYNTRGQMTLLDRAAPGTSGVPTTTYSYYGAADTPGNGEGDSNFRLSNITSGGLLSLSYQYDKVGNITHITNNIVSDEQAFTYDHLNRLDTAVGTSSIVPCTICYNYDYVYDLLGNLKGTNGSTTYNYTPSPYAYPQPHAVKSTTDGYNFTYDANGNMTGRTDSTGSYDQDFDRENRLESVEKDGAVTQFTYDANGQRVKTIQPDGTIIYTPFPNYEVTVKPDAWQGVSFTPNGYSTADEAGWTMATNDTPGWAMGTNDEAGWTMNTNDTPGWTMVTADTPGWYFETPASLSWTSTRTFPGTTTRQSSDYQLNNLATGVVQSTPITVTPDEQYTLSAWVKGELNGGASPGSASVRAYAGETVNTIWLASSYSNTTWQQVQGTVTVPSGVSSITIELVASQINGWIAFDDLSLIYKGQSIPIPNSSFESGPWTESPSIDYPATSIWRGNSGPATAHQGSYSYVLSNLGNSTLTSPVIEVEPGTVEQYGVSLMISGKLDGASSAGEVRLEALYYESGNLKHQETLWSTPSFSSSNWQLVGGDGIFFPGANQIQLRLVSEYNNISLSVDDVTSGEFSIPGGNFEPGHGWTTTHHPNFPASTVFHETVSSDGDADYIFSNSANGYFESGSISVRAGQRYELQALVSGELNSAAATGNGRLQIDFYNNLNALITSWNSVVVPNSTVQGGYFTTPANTATVRLRLVVDKTNGWLTFDDVTLTSQSAAISSGPGQNYDLSAWVRGTVAAPAGQLGSKIRVDYYASSGTLIGTDTIWSSSNYNQTTGNGQKQSGTFITPGNTASFRVGLELHVDNGWLDIDDITLTGWSAMINSGKNQDYTISALVSGNVDTNTVGEGGRIFIDYFPTGSDTTEWQSPIDYNSPSGTTQTDTFTTYGDTTGFKIGYEVRLDTGKLGFDVIKLTGWSDLINSGANQTYDISASVSGLIDTNTVGEGGRILVDYFPTGGDTTEWQAPVDYNSAGSTQTGSFTTYADTTGFKIGYEVRLDTGKLGFDVIKLTGYSGNVSTSGDQTYEFSSLVSGVVSAPAGDGGKIQVHFTGGTPTPLTLWSSPANYNSPGGSTQTVPFTTPAGTTSFKLSYEVRLDNGRLGFSSISLKQWTFGGTTNRSLYSLAGQMIAQRQTQENSTPQLVDTFSDNNSSGWTAYAGTWNLTATTPNGYAYQQTNTTNTATNSYYNLTQNSPTNYYWKMTFQSFGSTPRGAGFYFFASDANNSTYHGYAYSVWQKESGIQLCENTVNGSICQVNNAFTAVLGTTYSYKVTYNPTTGQMLLWRDGALALAWTDSTPLTSGNHIAFRTQKSNVRFDDVRVTTYTSSLAYFFSDHLGSNSVMSDSNGAGITGSWAFYEPFGNWRGTPPSANLTDIGYTGHRSNNLPGSNDLGLIYMNARYYIPSLNRFISADTIVPDPNNPQNYNRYSYVLNNPLKLVDPSGHCAVITESFPDGGTTESRDINDWQCWNEYDTLTLYLTQFGYDPLEYLGLGSQWNYIAIEFEMTALMNVYENSDWQKDLGWDKFLEGYLMYNIYMANPNLAFDHNALNPLLGKEEPMSYTWADIYSGYVLHQLFVPYGDEQYIQAINRAHLIGDEDLALKLSVAWSLIVQPSQEGALPDMPIGTQGSQGLISELKDWFIGQFQEAFEGLLENWFE